MLTNDMVPTLLEKVEEVEVEEEELSTLTMVVEEVEASHQNRHLGKKEIKAIRQQVAMVVVEVGVLLHET